VVSGDYKRESDPTCEPFQTVTCDVFITEATFGTPAHQWKKQDVAKDIQQWWKRNEAQGINSVLYAYSLGKTQRILGVLADLAHKPIYCHPAAQEINQCYREQGIRLAESRCLGEVDSTRVLRGELFIVPQGFLKNDKAAIIGSNYKTAFASGWMNAKSLHYGSYDTGFVMSDHADWNDLIQTVQQSQAKTIYVQHRGQGALVKHLKTLGLKAFPDSGLLLEKKMEKHAAEPDQMAFF
jgi:putative mRNA 3-end processing factor